MTAKILMMLRASWLNNHIIPAKQLMPPDIISVLLGREGSGSRCVQDNGQDTGGVT